MNRPDLLRVTTPLTDDCRRDAWDELLLRRALQAQSAETSPDEHWRRISHRITTYDQLRTVNEAMALRGAEARRALVLWRPWPSLQPLFS